MCQRNQHIWRQRGIREQRETEAKMLVQHLPYVSGHGCMLDDMQQSVTKAVSGPAFTELTFKKRERHIYRQPRVFRAGMGEAAEN